MEATYIKVKHIDKVYYIQDWMYEQDADNIDSIVKEQVTESLYLMQMSDFVLDTLTNKILKNRNLDLQKVFDNVLMRTSWNCLIHRA